MSAIAFFTVFVALFSQAVAKSVNSTSSSFYGIDVSVPVSVEQAECLKNAGMSYIIPRGYRSIGEVDLNVCNTLKNAASVGILTRDCYFFPCPTCSKSPATQMRELLVYLSANCKAEWSGRVWLDIEGAQYWLGNYPDNQAYYKAVVDACTSVSGLKCGVYGSLNSWSTLFGDTSFAYGNELPIWYPHYNYIQDYTDFVPFGGWDTPHAKQFSGDASVCNTQVDQNWGTSPF